MPLRFAKREPVFPFSVSGPGNGHFSVCSIIVATGKAGVCFKAVFFPSMLYFSPKCFCILGYFMGRIASPDPGKL